MSDEFLVWGGNLDRARIRRRFVETIFVPTALCGAKGDALCLRGIEGLK